MPTVLPNEKVLILDENIPEDIKHAVMLFDTEINLGISTKPNRWVNYHNLYFKDGFDALTAYTNVSCPASQLVSGKDNFELQCNMGQMILNYSDEDWLNTYLYPYM